MKKLMFLFLAVSISVFTGKAQSSYVMAGIGFLPNSLKLPNYCWSCNFPFYNDATEDWLKSDQHSGYSLYIGLGKDIRLNNRWALQGAWKIQHQTYPSDVERYSLEKSPLKELLSSSVSKEKNQLTNVIFSLSLERNFTCLNREWAFFGGGYMGVKLEDWEKTHYQFTDYYTDIITQAVYYDSIRERYVYKIVSKTKLEPPATVKGDYQDDAIKNPSLNYGIHAGLSFPILSAKEGQLNGQVVVSQDFNEYLLKEGYEKENPNFRQTSVMAGVVFKPVKVQRSHPSKPEKKTLSSGVYAGISLHNLFLSINGGWLSTQNLGLDFAARTFFLMDGLNSVYLGPNYRLGNFRLFMKGGLEYFWVLDSEGYDEAFFRYFAGGKYVIPFSRRIGLQLEGGYYSKGLNKHLKENHRSFPGFGVGIILLPAL